MKISKIGVMFISFFCPARQVLNKDPTVWMDGVVPANTSILPCIPGTHTNCHASYQTPKCIPKSETPLLNGVIFYQPIHWMLNMSSLNIH